MRRRTSVYMLFHVMWLLLPPEWDCIPPPTGTFQTKCLDRHFWLSVKSEFLGPMSRFDFQDHDGLHFLSHQEAALCGYNVRTDDTGDLVLRASFLACHVHSQAGSDFHLNVWFVNGRADGTAAAFPLHLRCGLQGLWGTREMVCEENYMEVSLQTPVRSSQSKAENTQQLEELAVMVHRAQRPPAVVRPLTPREAAALGYRVSLRGSRLLLRCHYSSPLAGFVKEQDLEVVTATILLRLHGDLLAVDASIACPLTEASVDGPHLLWTAPHVLTPLVSGRFRSTGMRVGVNSAAQSDVRMGVKEGRVEVRVPVAAVDGHVKSGVARGRYSQSVSVELFFMSQWQDELWPVTQHRSFRLLRTPLVPHTPAFTDDTDLSEGVFSAVLGPFPPDVSLHKVAVEGGGDPLIWTQSHGSDLNVSRIGHSDRRHSYQLRVPLSHPRIIPEFIGGGHKTFSLTFTFSLSVSPGGDVFYHQVTVEQSVQSTAPASPRLEGKCTESSLLVLLHHGPQAELQWELLLGGHRLDWELVETAGLKVAAREDVFMLEVPLHSPGVNFETLSLRGLDAVVDVSVVDAESLDVQDQLLHHCTFSARELVACLPGGRMVALVDTTHTVPPTQPNRTTLLDPSCVPMETDSARALFSFVVDSCGTSVTTDGDFLVYENQIHSAQDFLPADRPVIHRDSPYRLNIQCRYPANASTTLVLRRPRRASVLRPVNSSLDLSPLTVTCGNKTRSCV